MVGAHAFNLESPVSHPHVNIYCNGAQMLSIGYQPGAGPHFPVLERGTKDMWLAAWVTWNGNQGDPCKVEGIPSRTPNGSKDGSTAYCVERVGVFRSDGGFPQSAGEACQH